MTRWDVQRYRDTEGVTAEYLHVLGGALVFFDDDPAKPTIVYAPGAWTVAVKEED